MRYGSAATAFAFLAALCLTSTESRAWDETAYPDLKGQWRAIGDPTQFDPRKARGLAQQAPLTPEYQALFEAAIKDQVAGGEGPAQSCVSPGMPRVTNGYGPLEVIVTPRTTHIMVEHINDSRRIYTDGRDWPQGSTLPTSDIPSAGGSIRMATAAMTSWRSRRAASTAYDDSGIPLHEDNLTIVRERIFLDKSDPNILHDEVAVIDHALTRPWVVTKSYRREPDRRPNWREVICAETNNHVEIGKQDYMVGPDGQLMPTRKDQPPPDLRYFNRSRKEGP
jgi:hypothetical protein